jgi:hypothetical protein
VRRRELGQTLAAFALFLPLVLLPIAGYAVQATLLATRASLLHAAVARAAEDAGAAVDVAALRSSGVLTLDPAAAIRIARSSLLDADPRAQLDALVVESNSVTVTAHDEVPLSFGGILRAGAVTLKATAAAKLMAGYLSPSSRVPLPKRSLSMTG